jgi:hypothetical protein
MSSFFSNEGSSGPGGGGDQDFSASYILYAPESAFPNALILSGTNGILQVQGPGHTLFLSFDDNVVAGLSGSTFRGPVVAGGGLSGSLQQTSAGLPYLLGAGNINLITNSFGQIIISGSGAGGSPFDPDALFLVTELTSSLHNERKLVGGTGIDTTDLGANNNFVLSLKAIGAGTVAVTTGSGGSVIISGSAVSPIAGTGIAVSGLGVVSIIDNVVATISGANFTGPVTASAGFLASGGMTGSLQKTVGGLSYLAGAGGVTITSQSNGQIIVSSSLTPFSASGGSGILINGSLISTFIDGVQGVTVTTGSNGQVHVSGSALVAGPGIVLSLDLNNNIIISNSVGGDVSASYVTIGNTGSLPNERGLAVTADMSLVDGGAGASVTIGLSPFNSFQLTQIADVSASYITVGNTGSLPNERKLTAGSGLTLADGGAGANITFGIDNSVVATISGSTFAKLSGSLQQTAAGLSYLVGAGPITVTSQSNGQIIISGSSVVPTGGAGILVNGAGVVAIDPAVVATLSGSTFVQLSGSLQKTAAGLSYLVGAGTVSVLSQTNGQVIISGSGLSPTGGTGINVNGAGVISINDNVVATLSGSKFSGPVNATAAGFTGSIQGTFANFSQITGSLTQISAGVPYLIGGGGISVISQSNGQVMISGSSSGGGGTAVTSVTASFPFSVTGVAATPSVGWTYQKPVFYLADGAQSIDPSNGTDFVLQAGVLTAARTFVLKVTNSGPRQSINMWIMSQSFPVTVVNNGPITGTIYTGSNGTPTLSKYFFDAANWNLDWYERLS